MTKQLNVKYVKGGTTLAEHEPVMVSEGGAPVRSRS